MATYIILNLIFLICIVALLRIQLKKPSRRAILVVGSLLLMTAIFDSMIIYFNIVGYDTSKILGIYIGLAPIEDFFYALMAALLIPALWNKLGKDD